MNQRLPVTRVSATVFNPQALTRQLGPAVLVQLLEPFMKKKVHFWPESQPHPHRLSLCFSRLPRHPLQLFPGTAWPVTFARTHVGRSASAASVMIPRNFPRTRTLQALTRKGWGWGEEEGSWLSGEPRAARAKLGRSGVHPPEAQSVSAFRPFNSCRGCHSPEGSLDIITDSLPDSLRCASTPFSGWTRVCKPQIRAGHLVVPPVPTTRAGAQARGNQSSGDCAAWG